ncbi:MAG: orotidine-5'-phosphate decarboxylase, partial [Alphaproteobacteria bacterium HGW-Alphaproteobacteria-5]
MKLDNPVFCALDTTDIDRALALARSLKGSVGGAKIGMEFFNAHGHAGCRAVAETGLPIFLDLKLHDIPNTVAG